MTLNMSFGIGCRGDASGLLGINVPLNAFVPVIPYSRILRLITDRTAVNTHLTELRLMRCSKHQSQNLAASEVAYEMTGLVPSALAT